MTLSNAARIGAAERAVAYHTSEMNPDVDKACCDEKRRGRTTCIGHCLRIPKPSDLVESEVEQ